MWKWASSQPQYCLKFGTDSVAWAETERNWRRQPRHKCRMVPLEDGMVKPAPAENNLSNLSALAERIGTVTGSGMELSVAGRSIVSGLPRRIALVLPDAAVRAMVLHLDQLPARYEEREALIRWRLGQQQLFPVSGAKIASQVFPSQPGGNGRAQTVLAMAIQESVLRQYESLCESVGLIPQEVGITSLRLFDLWRSVSGGSMWQRQDFLWVSVSDQGLTTMIFQQGRLLFYRCKLLGAQAVEMVAKTELLKKILDECEASMEVCLQQHPLVAIKKAVICADGDLSTLQEKIESDLELSVEQLGWGSVEARGWVARGSHRGMTSLAAMAGVA